MRFEDLRVWNEAVQLVSEVYAIQVRDKNLREQMCRAVASITANIAEGAGSGSDAEFARFARYARRSCDEVRAHMAVATAVRAMQAAPAVRERSERVGRMLTRLIQALAPP